MCAKIYIRGVGEVEITNDKAIKFKDQWYQGLLKGHKIDLGDICFNGDDIKGGEIGQRVKRRG